MPLISALVLALWPLTAGAKSVYEIIDIIVADIINPLILLAFIAGTVFFLYGVVEYVAGASNEEARSTGRRHMIWGITGLLIMSVVYAIISIFENFFAGL